MKKTRLELEIYYNGKFYTCILKIKLEPNSMKNKLYIK